MGKDGANRMLALIAEVQPVLANLFANIRKIGAFSAFSVNQNIF